MPTTIQSVLKVPLATSKPIRGEEVLNELKSPKVNHSIEVAVQPPRPHPVNPNQGASWSTTVFLNTRHIHWSDIPCYSPPLCRFQPTKPLSQLVKPVSLVVSNHSTTLEGALQASC